jgi:hypothetical protein
LHFPLMTCKKASEGQAYSTLFNSSINFHTETQ